MAAESVNQKTRAYSAAHFALELDDKKKCGYFRSVEGGGIKAEIMTHQHGGQHGVIRSLGKPKYEDLKIQVGMSMSWVFYDWVESFFTGHVERRNGAIVAGDFHFRERARREFTEAIISEIAFPTLDGNDQNACYLTATIVPETLRFKAGSNEKLDPFIGDNRQKLWTPANFQLLIDGFKESCRRVIKVDGFTIKQKVEEYHGGGLRDAIRVPTMIEFPNITFYIPEVDASDFIDHFNTYVIKGAIREKRLTGSIELQDHKLKELATVSLDGIDIASITPDKSDATSGDIKKVKIEISIESMTFKYK